jgi:DNA-binding transcriptional regulator YdaS (Cro superfamily)
MRLPSGQASPLAHGKAWIEFDLAGVSKALGISPSALFSSGASTDPSHLLSYLRATSGQVTRVGTEPVQGVPTTHYRATIDYDDYASKVAPARRAAARLSIAALERLTGSRSQLVDVWVDKQHRVRREELAYRECLPGTSGASAIHLTLEFDDFGVQAIPAMPASAEVANVTSAVEEKLEHVKLGC